MPGRLQPARVSLTGGRSAVPSLPQWTALQGSLSSETPRRLLPANSPPSPVPTTPTTPSPPLPVGQRAWGWGPACSSWGGWWAVGRSPHAARSLCPIQAPETLPCEAHSGTIERGNEKPTPRGAAPPVPGSLGRRPSFLAPGVYIAPQGELGCLARAARGQSLTGPSQDPEPLASRRSRVFSALIFQGEHQPGLSPPPASSPLMTAVHPHVFWCPSGEGDGGQSERLPRPPSLCWPEPLSPTLMGRTLQAPQGPQSHVFTQSCKSAPHSPPPVR